MINSKPKTPLFILLIWLVFAACIMCSSCKSSVDVSQNEPLEVIFPSLLQEAIDNSFDQLPGVSMSSYSEVNSNVWNGEVGYDSKEKTDSLLHNQPFRIASVTKSFVAVAILKLHELDSISIHDSISKHLSSSHDSLLRSDGYDTDKITIKHCLNHTSGIFDYAMGGERKYIEICKQTPERRWTRTEQLQFAVTHGDKLFEPGAEYSYGDSGYIILGEIIEKYSERDLALGLRSLLKFGELGLHNTWLETLESATSELKPVSRYLGRDDFSKWDPSVDLYGGGGLMSTTEDIAKFYYAVFNGKIFQKEETLKLLTEKPEYDLSYDYKNDKRYKDYRCGMWKIKIYGMDAYMHGGLWGTMVTYVPELQTSFSTNCTRGWNERILKKAIMAVKYKNENN